MTSLNRLDGESHPRLEPCYNFHVTKIKQLLCKIYMSKFLLMTLNSDASVTNRHKRCAAVGKNERFTLCMQKMCLVGYVPGNTLTMN